MSEDTQSTGTEGTDRRRGPVGTVVGATLGPVGAALGTVVDDTRFALTFSVGMGADRTDGDGTTGRGPDRGTTIEIDGAEGGGAASSDSGPGGAAEDASDAAAGGTGPASDDRVDDGTQDRTDDGDD